MTYCLGIMTRFGLVMASDSRTNAGYDQVNVCQKMYTFAAPGERLFTLLASGSLSCTQSVITLLRRDFERDRRPLAVGRTRANLEELHAGSDEFVGERLRLRREQAR